jgi:hypothetical protein
LTPQNRKVCLNCPRKDGPSHGKRAKLKITHFKDTTMNIENAHLVACNPNSCDTQEKHQAETVRTGGVQRWSAGELYPWYVMVKTGAGDSGSCVPRNGETGEEGPAKPFFQWGGGGFGTFKYAHKMAERWVRRAR